MLLLPRVAIAVMAIFIISTADAGMVSGIVQISHPTAKPPNGRVHVPAARNMRMPVLTGADRPIAMPAVALNIPNISDITCQSLTIRLSLAHAYGLDLAYRDVPTAAHFYIWKGDLEGECANSRETAIYQFHNIQPLGGWPLPNATDQNYVTIWTAEFELSGMQLTPGIHWMGFYADIMRKQNEAYHLDNQLRWLVSDLVFSTQEVDSDFHWSALPYEFTDCYGTYLLQPTLSKWVTAPKNETLFVRSSTAPSIGTYSGSNSLAHEVYAHCLMKDSPAASSIMGGTVPPPLPIPVVEETSSPSSSISTLTPSSNIESSIAPPPDSGAESPSPEPDSAASQESTPEQSTTSLTETITSTTITSSSSTLTDISSQVPTNETKSGIGNGDAPTSPPVDHSDLIIIGSFAAISILILMTIVIAVAIVVIRTRSRRMGSYNALHSENGVTTANTRDEFAAMPGSVNVVPAAVMIGESSENSELEHDSDGDPVEMESLRISESGTEEDAPRHQLALVMHPEAHPDTPKFIHH